MLSELKTPKIPIIPFMVKKVSAHGLLLWESEGFGVGAEGGAGEAAGAVATDVGGVDAVG